MMGVLSKNFVQSDWLSPFEPLAVCGKIRSDMKEKGHHDGWGMVAYFRKDFPEYIAREPHSVTEDPEVFKNGAKCIEEAQAPASLIHFRKISVGIPAISNTHPFLHKNWAFAHNGTIFNSEQIPLQNLKPHGTTDSERFFLYLMERISQDSKDRKKQALELKNAIEEIKNKFQHTSLTFLLTDGAWMVAYRACDPQYENYYTLYTMELEGTKFFSSEPLPQLKGRWQAIENETLAAHPKTSL